MLYYLNGIVRFPWDLITNLVTEIIMFLGYPRIGSSVRPSSGSSNPVFIIFYIIFFLSNIFAAQFCGTILGGILWHIPSGFPFPLPRICGNIFLYYIAYAIKYHVYCYGSFLVVMFHSGCYFTLYGKLKMVLVVVGFLFMLG